MTKCNSGLYNCLKILKRCITPERNGNGNSERCRRDVVVRGLPSDGAGGAVSSYA